MKHLWVVLASFGWLCKVLTVFCGYGWFEIIVGACDCFRVVVNSFEWLWQFLACLGDF